MKKLIVLVFIAIASVCQAQTILVSNKNQIASYDTYLKDYLYSNINYQKIEFKFYETAIVVNDRSQSVYRIKSNPKTEKTQNYNEVSWVCQDEENRKCIVTVVKLLKTNTDQIIVAYSDKIFVYYLN